MIEDSRNVTDDLKGLTEVKIIERLDAVGIKLEIAIENLERDFNMGTIVRSANAFGVRKVHIIGSRQWNKRGAMATDKYLHVEYHSNIDDFLQAMRQNKRVIIAVDNIPGAEDLSSIVFPPQCVLVFGAEGPGISSELAKNAEKVVAIEQFGSTRSINVGVAAGIVMYNWLQQHKLK